MFLSVSVRHVRAHPGGHQHDVSIQIPINLGKTFLPISRIRNIPLTRTLARVFAYLPPFISQIQDLNYRTVLIFISIYFEWRDTENQQFYFFYHVSMGNERVYNDQLMEFFHFSQKMLSLSELCLSFATCHPPPATRHPREPPMRPRPFPSLCFGSWAGDHVVVIRHESEAQIKMAEVID